MIFDTNGSFEMVRKCLEAVVIIKDQYCCLTKIAALQPLEFKNLFNTQKWISPPSHVRPSPHAKQSNLLALFVPHRSQRTIALWAIFIHPGEHVSILSPAHSHNSSLCPNTRWQEIGLQRPGALQQAAVSHEQLHSHSHLTFMCLTHALTHSPSCHPPSLSLAFSLCVNDESKSNTRNRQGHLA